MGNIILDNISLIILLPLWIFLIIMCGRFFSVYVNKHLVNLLTLLSSAAGVGVCGLALMNITEPMEFVRPIIRINEFVIFFGLQVDKLSLIFALMLFIISFAVQLFSVSYMKNEAKNYKFFAFLNLFNFAMAFMLFSPNLFQFYVFWEVIGIVSYLLIGFDYKNCIKSEASRRVFLMNRIGDTSLITGIILTSYYMLNAAGSYSLAALSFGDFNAISTMLMAYTETPVFCLICVLFIIAAFVKSAQFPFHTWLQDAMEAKLPVSALLHSATMVAAGVYLVIKMVPFFTLNPHLTDFILGMGLLTALVCSIMASVETQFKKILAYSTSANLGLMFAAAGIQNIKAVLILFCAHALIKSLLFILIPTEKEMPKINFILFFVTSLSLAGVLFSGLGVKEITFKSLEFSQTLCYVFLLICFITAFYSVRLAILIYQKSELKNNANVTELTADLILFFGNFAIYIILAGSYHLAEPFAAAIGGIALAFLLGRHKALEKVSVPKLLEKLYNKTVPAIYEKTALGLDYIDNKVLSNYKPIIFLSKISVTMINWIEVNVMNKSVTLVSDISKEFSKRDMILQTKNVQTYNAYAFILLTAVIALVIISYTLIFK